MALLKTRNTALRSKQRGKRCRKGIKRWAGAQLVSMVPGTATGCVMVTIMKQPLHGLSSHGGRAGTDFTLEWDRIGNYQKELSRGGP